MAIFVARCPSIAATIWLAFARKCVGTSFPFNQQLVPEGILQPNSGQTPFQTLLPLVAEELGLENLDESV